MEKWEEEVEEEEVVVEEELPISREREEEVSYEEEEEISEVTGILLFKKQNNCHLSCSSIMTITTFVPSWNIIHPLIKLIKSTNYYMFWVTQVNNLITKRTLNECV